MTDLPDLIRWMREGLKGVEKVAPGPWETDSERQDDAPYRHMEFALFDARGLRLCGTENSDTSFGLIDADGPDEYGAFSTWNGPALTLMGHIKRCSPDNIAALLDHIEAQAARIAELEGSPHYGIIDPDYAKTFTVARCIAWSEGYAMLLNGSFTRDLDLLAVPWTEHAAEPEHLVKRIVLALDDLEVLTKRPGELSQANERPHGRLSWTLTFKTFGDPRFVDLSVMPRAALNPGASDAT